MKLLPSLSLLLLSSFSALSQSPLPDGLTVNGVRLGDRSTAVIRKLGRPLRDVTNRKIDECIGSRIRTMHYPGLKLELVEDERNVFTVFSFEVTNARWDVSGLRIGESVTNIEKRFGKNGRTVETQAGGPLWSYDMTEENPGGSNFFFHSGKLVRVQSGYMMC